MKTDEQRANLVKLAFEADTRVLQGIVGKDVLKPDNLVRVCQNEVEEATVEIARLRTALQTIADYDEQPIWADDRDDAASAMLDVAREALGIPT